LYIGRKLLPESLYTADILQTTGHPVQRIMLRMRDSYTFRAGQYLQIQAPDGTLIPLSIASSPTRLPELELHYRSAPELPEAQIMDTLLTGSTLTFTRAVGDVRCGAPHQRLFVIAGGSGAAQAFSCAEYRHATYARASTIVLWCADQAQDIYNSDLLTSYNDLDLHVKIDDRRTPDNEGLSWLDKHCADYGDSYVVLAGGPGFVYTATDILLGHGYNRNQLHADAYSYAPRE
jgi:CDP-4-dehydro-6-deoxyglucose reductase